jgi:protein-S-isoprenylcysteine O-methyltransferase Ste14
MVMPPPLYPLAMILIAVALQWVFPIRLPRDPLTGFSGGMTALGAILLLRGSMVTFKREKTPLEPWKATKTLVTDGVFKISRNPVYLAFLFVQAALAWWTGNAWMLGLIAVTWTLLDRLQVRREEAYLLAQFGDQYRDYCRRVRRWL